MKKILLSTSGALGDILVLLPILSGIRQRYPDAEITLFNKHGSVAANSPLELTKKAGYVDKIIVVSKWQLRLLKLLSLLPYPGRKKYDLVFYLQRDGRSLPKKLKKELPYFQRISREEVRGTRISETFEDSRKPYPQISEMMLERINRETTDKILPGSECLPFSEDDIRKAKEYLNSLHLPDGTIPFVCCIGGKKDVSRYPIEKYAEILTGIIKHTKAVPIFVGGPLDSPAIKELRSKLPPNSSYYAERLATDLWQSICFMSLCAFYLGNDTGSIHMAASAGLPCFGIYSSHAPAGLWVPLGGPHRIFRCTPEPDCIGCRKTNCIYESPARCINAIDPAVVTEAVIDFLKQKGPFTQSHPSATNSCDIPDPHRKRLESQE